MQIPEKLNKEIFDLNDDLLIQDKYIIEQYLVSLVWRKPELISENTFKYLNEMHGFTQCADIKIEGLECTNDELNQIKNILEGGIKIQ